MSRFLLHSTSNMVNTVLTDSKEDAHLGCSRCNPKPLAALLNHPSQVNSERASQTTHHYYEGNFILELTDVSDNSNIVS